MPPVEDADSTQTRTTPSYNEATLDPETVLASNRDVAKPFWVEKTKREAGKAWNLFYKQSRLSFYRDQSLFEKLRNAFCNSVP